MLLAQYKKNKVYYSVLYLNSAIFPKNSINKIVKKRQTMFELQSQVIHNLEEQFRLITHQMDKYRYKLLYNPRNYN